MKGIGGSTATEQLAGLGPWQDIAPPITREERLARIEKARKLTRDSGADALIVGAGTSLRYFAGVSWGGTPRIELLDVDYEGRGELLLKHQFEGRELDLSEAGEVLKNLARLWRRPVHLLTTEREESRLVTSDGAEVSAAPAGEIESSEAA